jgi:endonuclease YncB( thermonuclease family)
MEGPFVYRCDISRVVDGDTVIARIDLGFRIEAMQSVRILGINAPELYRGSDEERQRGLAAKFFVTEWVVRHQDPKPPGQGGAWPFLIKTEKGDSFGRWLGEVVSVLGGPDLATAIVEAGHADRVEY